ncbi:type II toxin-antitoxin system RelE/ParE family toxin [Sphingomonas sp. DT-51]|uniref:type II toxin-antitoxin system RelE/ParE family toxin n=1 Tax=Sphingomonas sp. DT-51 TaxID=3396165 RepID=UPI003F1CDB8E
MRDWWGAPSARRRASALAPSATTIVWARAALDDLRAIDAWLDDHATPATALAMVSAIRRRAEFLRDFPYVGRHHRRDTRVLRVLGTPYLIHYRLVGQRCEVLRVYHEREDWTSAPAAPRPSPRSGDPAGLA